MCFILNLYSSLSISILLLFKCRAVTIIMDSSLEKIKQFIWNWRQSFKTKQTGTRYVTSRQANRKFLNMIKGRRNVNRWRRRRRRPVYDLQHVIPVAPPLIVPSAPPMIVPSAPLYIFSDPDMPH